MGRFLDCLWKEERANPTANTTNQAGEKQKTNLKRVQRSKMQNEKKKKATRRIQKTKTKQKKQSETEMEDKPLTNGTNQEHREHTREPENRRGRCRTKTDELTNSEGRQLKITRQS